MKNLSERILIIELNEFCPEFLLEASSKLKLNNIKRIFNFNHTITHTNEKKEFHGLDPWVQWVSIHNGEPLQIHGIKRLGIKSRSSSNQIWNKLSKTKNISWIVTGAINASLGSKDGCISFFPDPWSSKEKAYPQELNNLLELPRYVSKNYLSLEFPKLIKKSFKTLSFFLIKGNLNLLKKLLIKLIQSFIKPGINIHTLTTLLDYILVLYFSKIKSRTNPDLSIIFLNHIAHLQHHFWIESPNIHPQMEHGLKICDEIIEILLASVKEDKDKILIINALKQERSGKNGKKIYRQINPDKVLHKLDIKNAKIEQNMTNDGTLIFENIKKTNEAYAILSNCHLNTGEKLFFVERISNLKIFIQLNINHTIQKDALIVSQEKRIPFYELFVNISRTGSHIQEGDIYSKNLKIPKAIMNHEIYKYIIESFK